MGNFSVLMSLYFKENPEHLHLSLESVFNQSVTPDEVILVEDGPLTDELYSVLDQYSRNHSELKRIRLEKNGGLGNALNVGLKFCRNELIARMDTDDIAKPSRFEKQSAIFEKFPRVDVVSSWIDEFEGSPDNVVSTRKLPEYHYEIFNFGKLRCPVNHPSVMFKKSAILFAGSYQTFPLLEDYYLWVRLLLNGAAFYNIQESLLSFRTTKDMYKRRGGFKHALTETKFQKFMYRFGYISLPRLCFNVFVRFTTRIAPNSLRIFIYKKFLRK